MKLFFATDIHGSELCFRKFLRAPDFYGVDALFFGGDYSSKSLVFCVRSERGWWAKLGADLFELRSRKDLQEFRIGCVNRGCLVRELHEDEFRSVQLSTKRKEEQFESALRDLLHHWTELASDGLRRKNIPIYHIPGNDEPLYCDDFFNDAPFVPVHRRHIQIGDNLAVLGIGGSNPTPWHTPREYEETELEHFLQSSLCRELSDVPLILFAHVPPLRSGLDDAPALNPDLSYKLVLGAAQKEAVGSQAIRDAIKRLQPVLGLFGHVHETRAEVRIGKTLCVNPGSAYNKGRLQGCIVTIRNGRTSVQFTEG